jgi:GntR family transcriptional regulator, rspAB operon transcriptional repressor
MQYCRAVAERQNPDHVYLRLRDAILDGDLAAGAVMSQVSLAGELGISRTPLREALRMLQAERLIRSEPNRRVSVAAVSARDLEELGIMRVTLEAQAVRLSLDRMTPEYLARLEGHMAEMAHFAQEHDYRRWGVPHRAFHRLLTSPAGERLSDLLIQLFDHAERYRRLHIGYGPGAWATADHREILDACKAGDRERAAALLATHLARMPLEAAELLEPGYDAAELRATLAHIGASAPGGP